MKTGCSFPLHDLHDIRPRLVSSFCMSSFPWPLTGFSGIIFFFFNFGSTRSSFREGNGTLQILLPGKSHERRSLEGCSAWSRWGSDMTEWLHFHFSLSCIGERNGCSSLFFLENPRDLGPWRADVYEDAQSRTQLKWLNSSSRSSLLLRNSLFSASRGYSVMAVH